MLLNTFPRRERNLEKLSVALGLNYKTLRSSIETNKLSDLLLQFTTQR